jgi:hypothetical protein
MPRKWWSEDKIQTLRDRYPQEGPVPLSTEWGISLKALKNQASRLGIKSLNRFERVAQNRAKNKQNLDLDYFRRPWSANLAYIVGYIWADGSLFGDTKQGAPHSLGLCCHQRDRHIIWDIRTELGSTHTFTPFGRKVRTHICNHYFVQPLVERFGLLPNKSDLDLPYLRVPDQFLGHFTRGYLDGDGWVSRRGTSTALVGSRQFIGGLFLHIREVTGATPGTPEDSKRTLRRVRWTAERDLCLLYNFLYPPGEYLYGIRKRTNFERNQRILNWNRN